MRTLSILVSACGAPGTAALLRALRENGERDVRLIGTDMSGTVVGRHLCDAFHRVPPGEDASFPDAMLQVCERERVDVVLPQSSYDLPGLAAARPRFEERGVTVLVSSPEAIRRSNDKAETYALLETIGVRAPAFKRVQGADAAAAAVRALGYPNRDVCFKPAVSSGSRGFRILSASADRGQELENRPGVAAAMPLDALAELLPAEGGPELLVMELASGEEHTVDGFAAGGTIALGHPKTRERLRAGLAMYFRTIEDAALMETAARIVAELGLDHFFNVQLVGDCVIEVNPRISTIVYQEDLNIPYLGVKHALGELTEADLAEARARIRPTRRALRYFDQLEWDEID